MSYLRAVVELLKSRSEDIIKNLLKTKIQPRFKVSFKAVMIIFWTDM